MLKRLLIVLIISALMPSMVYAIQAKGGKTVKVGISDNNFKNYYYDTVEISATDDFEVIDKYTGTVICEFLANTPATITMQNNAFDIYLNGKEVSQNRKGPIVISSQNGFIYIPNLKRANKPAIYRGTFELTKSPSKENLFSVINVLDLQSYLRGVVPNEMPVYFGLEALKAQTVSARNYVLKPREKNYHNFDVSDSVASQVYFGAATESDLSDRAVEETESLVAMKDGDLILALYSSTAGGYTENYENVFSDPNSKVFPAAPVSYLKGVKDNDKVPDLNTEGAVRAFYTSTPATFDNKSPYFRWTKEWSAGELEKVLKKTLFTNSPSGFVKPALKNEKDFGTLKDIRVIRRGVSGKAMAVEITTDKNVFVVQKELTIRRVFQKDSKPMPSANAVFEIQRDNKGSIENIVVFGGGFGHGVGLSQWGAGMMASMGYSYDEILKHYYNGIQIATYPLTLTSEPGEESGTVCFYTKEKKALIKIDNKFQFTTLTADVNSNRFQIELAPSPFKPVEVDISKYIKKGKNIVTFVLNSDDPRKKTVRVYIELNGEQNG